MVFGEKLKRLREAAGLTRECLAEEIGVQAEVLTDWEEGNGLPDISQVVAVSRRFGVTTDYLLIEGAKKEEYESLPNDDMSERAGKRLLGVIMGILSLIFLAFTPMFAKSLQLREMSSVGSAFDKWGDYILKAPLIYIFLLSAAGLIVSVYLLVKNKKQHSQDKPQ